jgi:hypothetical protein
VIEDDGHGLLPRLRPDFGRFAFDTAVHYEMSANGIKAEDKIEIVKRPGRGRPAAPMPWLWRGSAA